MKKLITALGFSLAVLSANVYAEDAKPEVVATEQVAVATTAAPAPVVAEAVVTEVAAVPAAVEAAPAEAEEAPTLDSGDTAWVLTASLLVLMMTLPGLALFYGGMVRKKNVLGTMMHSFGAVVVVTLVWVIAGYSLAFGEGGKYVGDFSKVLLKGVGLDSMGGLGTIPESLFVMFQLTFAIITVAILAGAFAERMKFSAFMVFAAVWSLVVYSPICHWVWQANGWLFGAGALDFAGGTVVHINAGIAGLVAAYVIGKRVGYGKEPMAPHNLVLTIIGAGLIWVGWFGFNAGSAVKANNGAAMAMLVTQVAAAASAVSWMIVERIARGKASAFGGVSGAVAGLVAITPAAGYVDVGGALILGLVAGAICFWGTTGLKKLLKADDSLDAFGLHGVGGIVGALLTGVLFNSGITAAYLGVETSELNSVGKQLWIQLEGVLATIVYSGIGTYIILKIIDLTIGLRVSEEEEREGLDVSQHGERADA